MAARGGRPLKNRWIAALVSLLLRGLGRTWRVERIGFDPTEAGQQVLAALWHRDAIIAGYLYRDRGFAIPVSLSRDGEQFDSTLLQLGFAESPRGSSSRGATNLLRELIRRLRRGTTVAMLPDGPRGPAGEVKPGVVALASLTGFPIWPAAFSARPSLRFGSWDRMILPLPFARVVVIVGRPVEVPKGLDEAAREERRRELERLLTELSAEADARAGHRG